MASNTIQYKALVVESPGNLSVKDTQLPQPDRGDVVIRVLSSYVNTNSNDVLVKGQPFLPGSDRPHVWGCLAVGRVEATGGDEVQLKKGDLVACDNLLRARDAPDVEAIQGLFYKFSPESKKLMNTYKDGFYAECANVPLESLHVLNEDLLLNQLGYQIQDLPQILYLAVGMGGLRKIGLKAGETVVIAPATGKFSGNAVAMASALGATVVAASRDKTVLDQLAKHIPRVHTLQLQGDVQKDAEAMQQWGAPDVFVDFSPTSAGMPSHITSGIQALRPNGRVCFLGAPQGNVEIPYGMAFFKGLTFTFSFMYSRQDFQQVVRMAESGVLQLGAKGGQKFIPYKLHDWKQAFEDAEKHSKWGNIVSFVFNEAEK
ncbi:hypothetical protein MPSI1_003680 [Malassezia psittaci]|uniref:Alcohol dehydrogenase n=1 Tax=Malassezia psittaci TaxID=1821823 RepID=A0AAF0FEF6_9BASI|nr:hypothetical protein MPSI1_003680 [Malassezia psittaci]